MRTEEPVNTQLWCVCRFLCVFSIKCFTETLQGKVISMTWNVIDCIRWNRKTGESFDGRNWSGMLEYLQDYVKKVIWEQQFEMGDSKNEKSITCWDRGF